MTEAKPLFDLDAYRVIGLNDSGARKLYQSGVAPLIAAARPYVWIPMGSADEYRHAAMQHHLGDLRSGEGKKMKELADRGGTLLIPLYRLDKVIDAALMPSENDGFVVSQDATQFRAENPVHFDGKTRKYDFAKGTMVPIDVHPALPDTWLRSPLTVVFSEGTIKTDAALTAICRNWGVDDQTLSEPTSNPRAKLRQILSDLPAAANHLCLSFAGVANWHGSPEWNTMPLRDRDVWVAFDKDVDTNRMVWQQASQLFELIKKRNGRPLLVDLHVTDEAGEDARDGLDDFLALHGTWSDFDAGRLSPNLPEAPPRPESPGDWRINESRLCAEEFVASDDVQSAHWEPRVSIAGRILKLVNRRMVTDLEEETGVLDTNANDASQQTNLLHLEWIRPHMDEPMSCDLEIDVAVLAERPSDWGRKAKLPGKLIDHPEWPPKPEWWSAVKAHREDEIEQVTAFTHMGWVPTLEDGMRFLVGEFCIGPNGVDNAAIPGCDVSMLAEAGSFGVITPRDDDDARENIESLCKHLLNGNVFNAVGMAELVTATALRPIIPLQVHTPIIFSGPRRVGKSWTAAAIMSFWQHRGGTWTENHLPGSTKDTRAANENTQGRALIWVYDDLAPSADRRQAQLEEAVIENVVRTTHNSGVKRRMSRDMKALDVLRPRALPIITAENELTVSSVMDRCIHYRFQAGSLGTRQATDDFVAVRDYGTPAIVAGTCVEWMAREIADRGYAAVVRDWASLREFTEVEVAKYLQATGSGSSTRHAKLAADIYIGLILLQRVADDLGMKETVESLDRTNQRFFNIPAQHYSAQSHSTPGTALLEALQSIMLSGAAYVANATDGGPPSTASEPSESHNVARMFGWSISPEGEMRHSGEFIGHFLKVRGRDYLLFDANAAFNVARQKYPDLIPPGSKSTSSWTSAWDEGIAGGHWQRPTNSVTVRVGATKDVRSSLRGVPIPIEAFLQPSDSIDDDSIMNEPDIDPDFD